MVTRRTDQGAGKSTLALAFFRFLEAEEGKMTIDNVNISRISLHSLRSSNSIISQEAILFKGNIRSNVDPAEKHDDQSVWRALCAVGLAGNGSGDASGIHRITSLDDEVEEGGNNLSMGRELTLQVFAELY